MSKINDGGLAFPGKRNQQVGKVSDFGFSDDDSPTFDDVEHPGMSLRDWFAGQALSNAYAHSETSPTDAAKWAYEVADAMLAVRGASLEVGR